MAWPEMAWHGLKWRDMPWHDTTRHAMHRCCSTSRRSRARCAPPARPTHSTCRSGSSRSRGGGTRTRRCCPGDSTVTLSGGRDQLLTRHAISRYAKEALLPRGARVVARPSRTWRPGVITAVHAAVRSRDRAMTGRIRISPLRYSQTTGSPQDLSPCTLNNSEGTAVVCRDRLVRRRDRRDR